MAEKTDGPQAKTPAQQGEPIDSSRFTRITGILPSIKGAMEAVFGPMDPMPQVLPKGSLPRTWDYRIGYNQAIRPRPDEYLDFATLRNLARSDYLLTTIIETSKDELVKIPWQFRKRRQPGMRKADIIKASATDKRISELTKFFEYPDREHDWSVWLRAVLDDYYVIDAVTLYPAKQGGKLVGLEYIDGATINRLTNEWGRTPAPPDPAYQQILKGFNAILLTTDDIIYRPYNLRSDKFYGFSRVEQAAFLISIALRRDLFTLNFYTEGNVPEGILLTPESWTAEQLEIWQEHFDQYLAGDLANRRKLIAAPGGTGAKLEWAKKEILVDAFDEWRARVYCYTFGKSPTSFIRQNNRATAETAKEEAEAQGNKPTMDYIANRVNECISRYWGYDDLEFAWLDERDENEKDAADIAVAYVKASIKAPNEVRDELGLDPVEGGDEPGVVTANGFVPLSMAGDIVENSMNRNDGENPQQSGSQGKPTKDGKKPAPKKNAMKLIFADGKIETVPLLKKKVSNRWSHSR